MPVGSGEVDHRHLIWTLANSGYDGWALSTNSRSLALVLGICNDFRVQVDVAAWVHGHRPRAQTRRPLHSWEPVVYAGGREYGDLTRTDSLVYAARSRLTDPGRVVGAKPATFARFVFELSGPRRHVVLDVGRRVASAGARHVAPRSRRQILNTPATRRNTMTITESTLPPGTAVHPNQITVATPGLTATPRIRERFIVVTDHSDVDADAGTVNVPRIHHVWAYDELDAWSTIEAACAFDAEARRVVGVELLGMRTP